MAKTKFLDYTGLAKLVEKIKNTYVNKNEQYEANLKWGGRNFASSYGPIDAAMVPQLGANRFAFGNPKGITVEYSNDGGNTWLDYGASDAQKLRLTTIGDAFTIGKVKSSTPSNDMLRITFDTTSNNGISCYTILNKFVIYISSSGSQGCYCTIQGAIYNTQNTFEDIATKVGIAGWTGYNVINTKSINTSSGSGQPGRYSKIRFIFGCSNTDENRTGLQIISIYAFGGVGWTTPSNMAKNGHLYDYDYAQNAIFPANVTATKFIGTLQGNANSASKLGTATVGSATKPMYLSGGTPTECTYTLAQNVTSASKLTDTTYSASTGLSLSKDNKFSINAATSSTIGGVKIGSGITVDTGGTISLTKTNVTNALGYTPPKADTNTTYTFTNGTGGTFTVKASNSDSGQTVSVGVPAKASAATSAETAATAATAEKVGSETVGSSTQPIYLSGGKPTKCTYTLAQSVTSTSKLTDHLYNAGEGLKLTTGTTADTFSLSAATSSTIGGVKIGNNISITSGTISLTKANVTTALGYTPPTADTNTHYTTGLIVGNSSSSTGNTAVTTNGVFLNLKDDNTIRNSHKIVGGGATTVTSDSGGTITISSTTYKDATISEHGLMTAADKVKLNSLAKVATSGSYADLSNKPTIPTSLPANGGKADSATQDSSGQKITSTYIKGLSVNGTTITYTKGDNSSGTINTQDTNTTYTFTNGTDGTFTVKASNSTKAQTISVGKTASASTADNAVNAQTAETANKLSVNAGSDMTPIYFKDGVPKPCDSTLGVNINGRANSASLADKLPIKAGSVSADDVLVIGNYAGGPIFIGGGIGPGEFTPTHIVGKDGDYYLLNVSKANTANSATTATSSITATYAKKYSYNGTDRDFVYDAVEGGNHYIRCKDATIISANIFNLNKYEFIINADGTGRCCIYDDDNSIGTFWGPDGMIFEKAPANSLVAANGTFATAISDTDIKNAINSAIDWTQAL